MEEAVPVHVGLMGHIDHGKTELARALSEHVSTAGLDKHPQAKERGITIDLGFTMFTLGKFLVTLVDAPGHADLIRSVVASANIIDAAILVVAANEGPKVQTGEHVVVLKSMGIESIVVAITKSDTVTEEQLQNVEDKTRTILSDVGFKRLEYVRVSAIKNIGIETLKETLLNLLQPTERDTTGCFLLPIDHAFPIKGHGTVVTGTILRGHVKIGDEINLLPMNMVARIRSIQTFGTPRDKAEAGDRVGINLPELDHKIIKRGSYLCQDICVKKTSKVIVRLTSNPLYLGRITERMIVSATIGMPNETAEIIPFLESEKRVIVDSIDSEHFSALLLLKDTIATEVGMGVMLLRTDLPPTSMRIVAAGEVLGIPESITLYRKKDRVGKISRVRSEDVLVEGLAFSKEQALKLYGTIISTRTGVEGQLLKPFGTRGVMSASFKKGVVQDEEVILVQFREEEY